MIRKIFVCSILPFRLWSHNEMSTRDESSIFNREKGLENGKERLYRMFSLDASGSFSPEITTVYQAVLFGSLVGGTYGGYKSSKLSPEEIERNKAIAVTMKFDERRTSGQTIGKKIASDVLKGVFQWGWRVGLFCGSMALITSVTTTYRGCSGILEYTLAGGIIGTLASWKGGVKGMAIRGVIGSALGTIFGGAAYAYTFVSGISIEEDRFWKYGWEKVQLKPSKDKVWKLREESRSYVESEIREKTEPTSATSNESTDK